jgi:DNA-directed RNA polymerase subunit F
MGLDSMLAANPGLLGKVIGTGAKESSQFMSPQEINLEKQKEEMRKKEQENKQNKMYQQQQALQQHMMQQQLLEQQKMMQQLQEQLLEQQRQQQQNKVNVGDFLPQNLNSRMTNSFEPLPANSKPPPSIPVNQLKPQMQDIRPPDEVKEILSRIHNIKPSVIKPTDTQDETSSNNDRLISESNVSESNPKRRGAPKKKSTISII